MNERTSTITLPNAHRFSEEKDNPNLIKADNLNEAVAIKKAMKADE
ncbi:hypothetical protein O9992_01945 [Vibrio lentus]|nr:hypothetical protein [Vibrio lentus]